MPHPPSLLAWLRLHALAYAVGFSALAGFQVLMNRIDWLARDAVDRIFLRSPGATKLAALIFGAAIAAFVVRVASRWFIFNAGRDIEFEIRSALLRKLHTLGPSFYSRMSAGEILSRSANDLLQVRLLFGFAALNAINVVFAYISALHVMLTISSLLTLAGLVFVPFLVFATRAFAKRMFAATKAGQEALGQLSSVVQSNATTVRVWRAYAIEEFEYARFQVANRASFVAGRNLANVRGLMGPVAGAAGAIGLLSVFWFGSTMMSTTSGTRLSPGEFYAFWQAFNRLLWPTMALGFVVSIIQRGRSGYARLQEVFSEPDDQVGSRTELMDAEGEVALAVRGIGVSFGNVRILENLEFSIHAGERVAIMGRSGSGKTTLSRCLAGALAPDSGEVCLFGTPIRSLARSFLGTLVVCAPQEAYLFSRSVSDNVAVGLSADSRGTVNEALRAALVESEVLALPEGIDTVVGERGVQLSGGQRQRVALARALAAAPKVLILDDPLSAVDAKTESGIVDNLFSNSKLQTLVVVTHRVSVAGRCDRVIVLEGGRILESGTPSELVALGGTYAQMASIQQAVSELDAAAAELGESL